MDHPHIVSVKSDAATLKSKVKDCVTQGSLKAGDEVIVCSKCRLTGIYRKQDWAGSCIFCGGKDTLSFPNGMDAVFYQKKSVKPPQPKPHHQKPQKPAQNGQTHGDSNPNSSGFLSCLVIALLIGGIIFFVSKCMKKEEDGKVLETTPKKVTSKQTTAVQTTAVQTTVPASVVRYPDNASEFLSHMYKYYNISLSWSEAEKYCRELGGHLVSINSAIEQRFVESLTISTTKQNIWIGGYLVNGFWRWTDGTAFDYQNWDTDKPDNYMNEEFYLRYASTHKKYDSWSANRGKWDDCAENGSGDDSDAPLSSFGFVCEWDSVS